MFLSSITNSSLFGYAAEMQIRQMGSRSTNLAGNNEVALVTAIGVAPKQGMILPFQPLAMSFEDVNYLVDMPPIWNFIPKTALLCDSTIAYFCAFSYLKGLADKF